MYAPLPPPINTTEFNRLVVSLKVCTCKLHVRQLQFSDNNFVVQSGNYSDVLAVMVILPMSDFQLVAFRVCNNVIHGKSALERTRAPVSMDDVQKLAVVFFLVYWTSQALEAQGQGKLSTYRSCQCRLSLSFTIAALNLRTLLCTCRCLSAK